MPLRRHHDDDYCDRITIQAATGANFVAFIRPRYKMSWLSGDEWRISAVVEVRRHPSAEPVIGRTYHRMRNLLEYVGYFVYANAPELLSSPSAVLTVERKGHVLMREGRRTFGDAVIGLGWHIVGANEGREGVEWHHLTDEQERSHCQQVGCAKPPVVAYQLKKLQVAPSESVMIDPPYDFVGQFTWYCSEHRERGDCGLEDCDGNMEVVSPELCVVSDQAERDEHVRPEIQALIARGDVTSEEFKKFGFTLNWYEKPVLIAALSDEAFLSEVPDPDSSFPGDKDRLGFNVAFEACWGTESLKRFKSATSQVRSLTETIVSVHDALGQTTMRCRAVTDENGQVVTRHPVLARDVKELVEAIESRCDALVVLKRIREKT